MLTAPRISFSRVCPMSDLVRLEPGCQAAATLWLLPSHSRGSLCKANRGYRLRLLSTMCVPLYVCKREVQSRIAGSDAGRQAAARNYGLIDLGLFGDAGSPQRYGYAMQYNLHPPTSVLREGGVVLVEAASWSPAA